MIIQMVVGRFCSGKWFVLQLLVTPSSQLAPRYSLLTQIQRALFSHKSSQQRLPNNDLDIAVKVPPKIGCCYCYYYL